MESMRVSIRPTITVCAEEIDGGKRRQDERLK